MNKALQSNTHKDSPQSSTSYQIEKKTFVVEAIFEKDGKETLGNVLLRLIKADLSSA